jgi:hypothetical protein
MKKIILGILILFVSSFGLLLLACETEPSTGASTVPKVIPSASITLTNPPTMSPAVSITPSISTTQSEPSMDIGAVFPIFSASHGMQVKYVSFSPVISRSEAIVTARNWLTKGFNIFAENYPVDSTVGLISGDNEVNSTHYESIGTDVKAWIVVIIDLPSMGSVGPPLLLDHPEKINMMCQANVAINALTGQLIYAGITGKEQRIPVDLNAFPVQYLPLSQTNTAFLGIDHLVMDNGYLRVSLEKGNSFLLLWPPGYTVSDQNNIITVIIDHSPDFPLVAQISDEIQVSGRNVLPNEDIQKLLTYTFPKDAPGPYWLIGDVKKTSTNSPLLTK